MQQVRWARLPGEKLPAGRDALSCTEEKVASHLGKGFTREEISERMQISIHGVNTHIERIYKKRGVHNAAEAVAKNMYIKKAGSGDHG